MPRTSTLLACSLCLALALPGCSLALGRSNGGIPFLEQGRAPVRVAARGGKYLGWILGAPLAVLLLPPALLAAATPWVDLSDAVDVATGPALGLGYACQAAFGFPVHGALAAVDPRPAGQRLRRVTSSPQGRRWNPPRAGMPYGLILDHFPLPPSPRAPAPLPPEEAAYYAPEPARVASFARSFARAIARAAASPGREPAVIPLDGALRAKAELYRSRAPGPRPLVLLTPPNRVTSAARYLARHLQERGAHALVVVPDEAFLSPGLAPREVERKLRAAVVGARELIAALAPRAEVDAQRLSYMGISAGGIFGAVLLAVEPRLGRGVLWLPGGDLPRIVAESVDREVRAYRESWQERGVEPRELARRLRRWVRTDPLRLAAHHDPRQLLIFLGGQDESVPTDLGLALHEGMGRPQAYMLAGEHASAVVAGFGWLLDESEAFLLGSGRP